DSDCRTHDGPGPVAGCWLQVFRRAAQSARLRHLPGACVCESMNSHGFRCKLQLKPGMNGADNPKEPFDSSDTVKKRILIIDDDNEVRSLLSRTLSQAGFEVFTVARGEEVTRLCRQQSMDLVIVDMIMPEKDGLETLMEIRRGSPKCRILAMSGAPRTN